MNEKVFTKAEDDIVRDLGIDAVRDAALADAQEHSMTLRQAFNAHRKAIFWSMALSGA
jgi:SP family general alpha glucoside:H+ symporter-like MFS transporter